MRVLFVSNLFPNLREPTKGTYNAQFLSALSRFCDVVGVIAPTSSSLPDELYAGVPVSHPRFIHIPYLSRPLNGWLFARCIRPVLSSLSFDIALVEWAYPDAFGVMLLARELNFPFASRVLGSDVNEFFKNPLRKRQILDTLSASEAVFAVSDDLRITLGREGVTAITVLNGVDHTRFHPMDRSVACAKLGLKEQRRRVLFVGNLVPVKGPTVLLRAFEKLHDVKDLDLVILGDGPERRKIQESERIQMIGVRPHLEIPVWMNACDLLCLPSLSEGCPNVAIEALACGCPVVASEVGGTPEIVRRGETGLLVPPGEVAALASALHLALHTGWDRSLITQSVASFDWSTNARFVHSVLERRLKNRHGQDSYAPAP